MLYTKTRRVKNRAALALRLSAQCLNHAKSYLGEFFRRMKRKLGAPKAVTATAHKLARILFHMLLTKEPTRTALAKCDEDVIRRAEARLRKHTAKLGYQIIPKPAAPTS